MASNKTGIRKAKGSPAPSLGEALLSIIAAGVTFGAALIGMAVILGEGIEDKQASDLEKLEKQREADREEVRRISAVESGTDCEVSEIYSEQ